MPDDVHTYMPDDVHTYMPDVVHTYMPDNVHTYMPDDVHTYMPDDVYTYMPDNVHTYMPDHVHTHMLELTNQATHLDAFLASLDLEPVMQLGAPGALGVEVRPKHRVLPVLQARVRLRSC